MRSASPSESLLLHHSLDPIPLASTIFLTLVHNVSFGLVSVSPEMPHPVSTGAGIVLGMTLRQNIPILTKFFQSGPHSKGSGNSHDHQPGTFVDDVEDIYQGMVEDCESDETKQNTELSFMGICCCLTHLMGSGANLGSGYGHGLTG